MFVGFRPSLITTSAIIGLGASPLWSALSTYITISGNLQAETDKRKSEDVIHQYFGIVFLAYQSSNVWGNLLSSLILKQDLKPGKRTTCKCSLHEQAENNLTYGNWAVTSSSATQWMSLRRILCSVVSVAVATPVGWQCLWRDLKQGL